jgi:hypothetical protein
VTACRQLGRSTNVRGWPEARMWVDGRESTVRSTRRFVDVDVLVTMCTRESLLSVDRSLGVDAGVYWDAWCQSRQGGWVTRRLFRQKGGRRARIVERGSRSSYYFRKLSKYTNLIQSGQAMEWSKAVI